MDGSCPKRTSGAATSKLSQFLSVASYLVAFDPISALHVAGRSLESTDENPAAVASAV